MALPTSPWDHLVTKIRKDNMADTEGEFDRINKTTHLTLLLASYFAL